MSTRKIVTMGPVPWSSSVVSGPDFRNTNSANLFFTNIWNLDQNSWPLKIQKRPKYNSTEMIWNHRKIAERMKNLLKHQGSPSGCYNPNFVLKNEFWCNIMILPSFRKKFSKSLKICFVSFLKIAKDLIMSSCLLRFKTRNAVLSKTKIFLMGQCFLQISRLRVETSNEMWIVFIQIIFDDNECCYDCSLKYVYCTCWRLVNVSDLIHSVGA